MDYTFYYGEEMEKKTPHRQTGRCFPFTVLVYVCRGTYLCSIGQENLHVEAGETLVVPPYVYHDIAMTDEGTVSWAHISAQSEGIDLLEGRSVPNIFTGPMSLKIGECIRKLNHGPSVSGSTAEELFRDRYISEIYCELLSVSKKRMSPGKYRSKLEKIRSCMLTSPGSHYTLSLLAEKAGLSVSTFSRHFQEAFHMSPLQYLEECRIKRAAFLLASGDPVHTVAESLGYYDAYHFSRQFKKKTGLSPSAYARTHTIEV